MAGKTTRVPASVTRAEPRAKVLCRWGSDANSCRNQEPWGPGTRPAACLPTFHIRQFTPAAVELFHLMPGDVGRPIEHFAAQFSVADLLADAREV
ncbi:MAG: PAS domain-containing protein, partial [Candidatus Riflebacteria bacterium]|nr:PAS domain-containing protein [Candidatus Riflebacteria bacterium]